MCESIKYGRKLTTIFVEEMGSNILHMRRKCKSERRLDGKVVIITGANTGIGKETALQLSLRGAKIYIGCRDLEKAESAVNDIKSVNPGADITSLKLDLSSLKSIRHFANEMEEREPIIDILVNNAGIMMCPEWQTTDGFEMQFGTNYLGPFLLTLTLLPQLQRAPKARVVSVSAKYYEVGKLYFDNLNLRNGKYDPTRAYAQSKLAQVLFTRELSRRLGQGSTVTCYALHPGVIKTDLQKHVFNNDPIRDILFLNTEMGVQTTLYCVLDEQLDTESGFFYDNCKRVDNMPKHSMDETAAKVLWDMSCELVNLEDLSYLG